MKRTVVATIAIGAGIVVLLLAALAYSGFADVPCQDGLWDAERQTCVPT